MKQFVWIRRLFVANFFISVMSINMMTVNAIGVISDKKPVSPTLSEADEIIKGMQAVDSALFFYNWGIISSSFG